MRMVETLRPPTTVRARGAVGALARRGGAGGGPVAFAAGAGTVRL